VTVTTSPPIKSHPATLSRSYLASSGVPIANNPNVSYDDVKVIGEAFGFLLWLDNCDGGGAYV